MERNIARRCIPESVEVAEKGFVDGVGGASGEVGSIGVAGAAVWPSGDAEVHKSRSGLA